MDETKYEEVIPSDTNTEFKTWQPHKDGNPGDELEGVYKELKKDVGKHKKEIYVITTKEGDVDVWECTAIKKRFNEIEIGTSIGILYKGEGESPNGTYHDYKVYRLKTKDEVPVIEEGEDVSNVPF
jgi:hypothetical protein